jgi:signal peptidase I
MSDNSTRPSSKETFWENVKVLAIALVIALLVRTFIAEPRFIPSDSMVPTLQKDDRLIIEKVSYWTQLPKVGDIVVFSPPEMLQKMSGYGKDQALIKRVIGVPGDRIVIREGKVTVNGVDRSEPYIKEPPNYTCPGPDTPFCQAVNSADNFEVPAGQYFVMGDNRNNSNDSHVWGFLPKQEIIGRAWVRFFPFDRWGAF